MRPHPTQASPGTPPSAAPVTDLFWRGRPLSKGQVATAFLWGSLLLVAVGVGLNYVLTDGTWHSKPLRESPFGSEEPSYLTANAYDVVTLLILLTSIVGLGIGFMAALQPSLRSRWFHLLLFLAVLFLGSAYLTWSGWVQGDTLLLLTLGVLFALSSLIWFAAPFVGAGPRMHYVRAAGFVVFGFYWATQAMRLYTIEQGDFVNAFFAAAAVFFFNYFAYQELLSARRNEDPRALHWLAGAAFLTTGLYVATHKIEVVGEFLILHVAEQTTWLLQWFGEEVIRDGGEPTGSMIYYPTNPELGTRSGGWFPVQIILACTAVQSIMIFLGGIFSLRPPMRGDGVSGRPNHYERLRPTYQQRRFFALLLTVPLIYVLNLFRNVAVIALSGTEHPAFFSTHPGATEFICGFSTTPGCGPSDAAFWFSHNIIGKGGSLLALVIIAFMMFQILPELYDSLVGLLDLKQRRGPLERWFGERLGRRGNGGARAQEAPPAPSHPTPPATAPDRLLDE